MVPSPTREFLISTKAPALAPLAQLGAGAQVGERADVAAVEHLALDQEGVRDRDALAELGVGERGQRADDGAGADLGRAAQAGARLDAGVGGDLDAGVDPGRGGVDDGDAGDHVGLEDAAAGHGLDRGELRPVVDAHRHGDVVGGMGGDGVAGLAQRREDVGQVVLALGVVVGEAGQGLGQGAGVEGVGAGVDLADRELRRRRRRRRLSPRPRARTSPPRRAPRVRRSRGRRARSSASSPRRPADRWASSRPAMSSAEISGWSPERTRTVSLSSISGRAARIAPPVPSASGWTTVSVPSGRPAERSCPGETIAATRPAPASRAARIGQATIGRPQTGCSIFGRLERMRVPAPAAMTRTRGELTRDRRPEWAIPLDRRRSGRVLSSWRGACGRAKLGPFSAPLHRRHPPERRRRLSRKRLHYGRV